MIFHNFPKTVHILGSSEVDRTDLFMGLESSLNLLANPNLNLSEKVDGSNIGILYDEHGSPLFQHRGQFITPTKDIEFKKLDDWYNLHENELFDLITDKFILFGEWSYYKHTVKYNKLHSFFLAFDIFNKSEERFLSQKRLQELLKDTSIQTIKPLYGEIEIKNTWELEEHSKYKVYFRYVSKLIAKSKYGDEKMEGLYLRVDDENYNITRAKLVRPNFTAEIKNHWRTQLLRDPKKAPKNKSLNECEKKWVY